MTTPSSPVFRSRAASRLALSIAAVLGLAAAMPAPVLAAPQTYASATTDARPFPREFQQGQWRFWLHAPQFEALDGNQVSGRAAISVAVGERNGADGRKEPVMSYGVLEFAARADIDKTRREALLSDIRVLKLSFPSQPEREKALHAAIQKSAAAVSKVASLDQLEASIALGQVKAASASQPVLNVAPEVLIAHEPTLLVALDGQPVLRPFGDGGVRRVINTRSLLLQAGGQFYLRLGGRWAAAAQLQGPWTLATAVSPSIEQARERAQQRVADALDTPTEDVAAALAAGRLPQIAVRMQAAELVPVAGTARLQPVVGTTLAYVANSAADLFQHDGKEWYVLLSGRWFSAATLRGPWTYVDSLKLPADFRRIAPDSAKSGVLASIAGTPEAQEALIANAIPQTATIDSREARFRASYDGAPDFVPLPSTALGYARNAAVPVFRVDARHYYAVSDGVWFAAESAQGPWRVAVSVDPVIYTIPVSSPLHHVTYVRVYGHAGHVVYVGYTPGYYGTVVSGNVVVYGSGHACTPWIGAVWYGCPMTYGSGAYFGYTAAVGWTFGFGWGYYAAYPAWGPYRAAYRAGAGAYYPVAGAWNVYGHWGSVAAAGTAAAWANPWTGNVGQARQGVFYNSANGARGVGQAAINTNVYTGTTVAAARGAAYNAQTGRAAAGEGLAAVNPYTGQAGAAGRAATYNTNTGRSTQAAGAAGVGPNGAATAGAFSSQGPGGNVSGAGYAHYDRSSGTVEGAGVARVGDDVYAGRDGNVYKHTDGGWESVSGDGGTRNARRSGERVSGNAPASGQGVETLNRERFARDRGAAAEGGPHLDRGAFNGGFSGRVGGERPRMNGGGPRPRR